ncbi:MULTISPECIES: hypothetical protein [unclassified Cyanobium]|uniref:hypothetical protein n=1 Tax=unclassified Cyanobium TaxID=2627006 RepID=UPI0020CE3A9A|nr:MULTISPECIES: hypothetical protein [unclassified Cyanobium]MCP9777141.1 hypothetical protein [Cyanobium sp. Tous-M-B4]MCP9875970.1 hypothetical protein [Cyanobium sp. A2C-AMD]
MTQPSRFPPSDRPDLGDRLLAAVAERDQAMAQRLVQQWAHRRGLAALEALIAGPLCVGQGVGAAEWLRSQAGLETNLQPSVQPTMQLVEQLVEQPVEQRAVLALVQDALAPAARNAAPAPFAHASLRAWLPDAEELNDFALPLAS